MLRPAWRADGTRDNLAQPRELLALTRGGLADFQRVVVFRHGLRQPPLTSAVVLAFAERFAPAFGNAEGEFLYGFVLGQCAPLAIPYPAAGFQELAVTWQTPRHVRVLLG